METKKELVEKSRNYPIKKSNFLVQNTGSMLTAQEFDLLQFLIMKIKDTDTEIKPQTIDVADYCRIAGLKTIGSNYRRIKESLKSLADKSVWLKCEELDEDGQFIEKEKLFRWIEDPEIAGNKIKIQLKKTWEPYLLALRKRYVTTTLNEILPMSSVYSKRLYEILVSYIVNLNEEKAVTLELSELKRMLLGNEDAKTKYKDFRQFNSKVLKKAVDEIEQYGKIHVHMEQIREGRKVVAITFVISNKDVLENLVAHQEQLKFFD